jgi:hypothetical protein
MQSDLNRSPLEINLALPMSHKSLGRNIVATPQLPEPQYLYGIGGTNREGSRQEEQIISRSNGPDVLFVQGSYRSSIRVRSSNFDLDILINSLVDLDLPKTPLTTQPLFPKSGDPWDIIEGLVGTIDGPTDWSSQHDHYLYGTPKR